MFYLTADSDVLYNRKHEINIDEIDNQKTIYEKDRDNKILKRWSLFKERTLEHVDDTEEDKKILEMRRAKAAGGGAGGGKVFIF